jgi:hypothetical protein
MDLRKQILQRQRKQAEESAKIARFHEEMEAGSQ